MTNKIPFWKTAVCLAAAAIIGFPGCTDLEEEPFSALPASEFGQTDEQFIAVLGAAYTSLYGLLGNHNSYWSLQEVSSDEVVIPVRGGDWGDGNQWVRVHTHAMRPNEESINNAWNFLYTGVSTTNRLIEQLQVLNPDLAAPFINELRGLRALYYYCLVDMFGNVPLITKFAGSDAAPATVSRTEVYNYVVSELTEIIPTLDPASNLSTYGRMNRNSARAILAKMYLNSEVYTGTPRYDQALAVCDSIIGSGSYTLEGNYFVNFNVDNLGSRENILSIPYDEVFAQGFNLGQMTLHYQNQNTFSSVTSPWNGYASLAEFYDSYDDNDIRKGIPGDQQTRGNFLVGPQFAADGRTRLLDANAEPGDPDGQPLTFTPVLNQLAPGAFRQAGARIAKFEYETGFRTELNNDFPIFRYADIILMKAECLMRTKGEDDSDARDLINTIRSRARADVLPSVDLEILLAERGREMFAEGHRRSDLIRFGRWTGTWWEKPASADFTKLMPIPTNQIAANGSLVQNPGY